MPNKKKNITETWMQGSTMNRNKYMENENGYAYLKLKMGKEMMRMRKMKL